MKIRVLLSVYFQLRLSDMKNDLKVRVSKYMSYLLRHNPEDL